MITRQRAPRRTNKLRCPSDGIRTYQRLAPNHRRASSNNIRPKHQNYPSPQKTEELLQSKRLEQLKQAQEGTFTEPGCPKHIQWPVNARLVSCAPFLWRKEQQFTEEMADEVEAARLTQETTRKTAAKRKLQKSRDRRQANYDRTRAQITGNTDNPVNQEHQSPTPTETQKKSDTVQPDFSKIHPASMMDLSLIHI